MLQHDRMGLRWVRRTSGNLMLSVGVVLGVSPLPSIKRKRRRMRKETEFD